jgi:hypothetical protein
METLFVTLSMIVIATALAYSIYAFYITHINRSEKSLDYYEDLGTEYEKKRDSLKTAELNRNEPDPTNNIVVDND